MGSYQAIAPPDKYPYEFRTPGGMLMHTARDEGEWADEMIRLYSAMGGTDPKTGEYRAPFVDYFLTQHKIPFEERKRLEKGREVGADFQSSFEELIDWVNTDYLPNREAASTSRVRPNISFQRLDPKTTARTVRASEEFQEPEPPEELAPGLKTKKFTPAGLGGGLPSTTLLGGQGGGTTFLG